ncbi:hypothetical protein K2X05_01815, partial [bacterium]|nr:hypothetical protein [bacterium]
MTQLRFFTIVNSVFLMNTLFFSLSNAQLILPTFSRQPYPISIQPCINAFDRIAGKTGDRLQLELESCVRQCERIDPTARMSFGLEVAYQFCKTNVGNTGATPVGTGAGPKCDAAAGKLSTTQDSVFWQTCVSDCDAATEETSDTKLKQKYTNTSSACGAKVPPAELETLDPTEGLDGGTVADDDTTDDDATDGD